MLWVISVAVREDMRARERRKEVLKKFDGRLKSESE
jgi:hypothetical protein